MEHHTFDASRCLDICRSETICCNNVEGKGRIPYATPQTGLIIFQITYDLHHLPKEALPPLRDSIISLLQMYSAGPRPIRTQLCVCLASLAIQMTSWKNVIPTVGAAIGNTAEGGDCMLDFLRILPEEVTEGRKVNLTVCSTAQHPMFSFSAKTPRPAISI